ncbi:SF1B family DNA helicase RecD2 [Thermicanus aegyptius]|uniref:SF1B family DNA helicase RecD2 n=1 Tax=Thermicanus aegyptius TaxID=94009 RepID=UPI000408F794|nr:ATP-dependent RecD-like DNA helicase [Thermicanus aegyptius]
MSESYTGSITKVIFRSDDFLIARFLADEEFTVTGPIIGIDKGEEITIHGEWVTHPKYGRQFKVEWHERPMPQTKDQIIAYLASPVVKGCGPKRAAQIVDHLGENALKIMMEQGESSIQGIKGIGKIKAQKIVDSVRQTYELQQIMMALLPFGITANLAIKAYKEYGSNTVAEIKRNPYVLTRLTGIGFLKADEIARKIGILPNSMARVMAGMEFVLFEKIYNHGHCFIEEEKLVRDTLQILNHNVPDHENRVGDKDLNLALHYLEAKKRIAIEEKRVYPKKLYDYEMRVSLKLVSLLKAGVRDGEALSLETYIKEYQIKEKKVLAEKQKQAIRELFRNNVLILTGNPGTGKTTVTKAIIEVYRKIHPGAKIGLSAPTGRAARKLSEVTSLPALTIHRLINLMPGGEPEFDFKNPLPFDLVIVDEVSMMDLELFAMLLDAIKRGTKLLLVGDADQLPSVNPGNVLHDLIEAGIPHVRLDEIFRQAQDSSIIVNAHRINKGKPILIDPAKDDFYFIEREEPEKIQETILKSVLRFVQKGYKKEDILVLSPMKKGVIGTLELNQALQEILNPPSPAKNELRYGQTIFRVGDTVIQRKNNYEKGPMNGDLGTIKSIETIIDDDGNEEIVVECTFQDKQVKYTRDEMEQLSLAYSITVHKSQGGQAKIVIMPVSTSHYIMLARNIIYTGITRAEEKVVLIGTRKALQIAISNNKIVKRNTGLVEKLKEHLQGIGGEEAEKGLIKIN